MHEVHNSERKSFRSCRRRWSWAYRDGYVPIEPEERLDFGIVFHNGMQAFYNPLAWDKTLADEKEAAAIESFLVASQAQKKAYLASHNLREWTEEQEDAWQNRLDLGVGMLSYHAQFVHPKFDDWFKPVAVEIPFDVPLQDPDNPGQPLRCTNSPACGQTHSNDPEDKDSIVVYSGRVDALMEDTRYGGYFIWDHKSAASLAKDDEFLALDDQVGGYSWALQVVLNLDIKGFIYAESRKDFPRPPRLLKRMQKGCSFSTSKTQSTNLEVYEPYVAQNDPVAYIDGCYDEYIEFLRSSGAMLFSQRFVVLKTDEELNNIGRNIAVEAADMVSNPRIYPNVSRFHCGGCKYREPCIGTFRGEDISFMWGGSFIQTDRRHWMEERRLAEQEVNE